MKRLFPLAAALVSVATAASAADFPATPMKAPLPAPILFSWTGCYVGVEGGGASGQGEQIANSFPNPAIVGSPTITGGLTIKGGIAGGTVGCNIQLSNFVVGGEADFSWTNKRGSVNDLPPWPAAEVSETRERWLDTFRGRFGYAIDRFMIYGTAGVAVAGTAVTVTNPAFGTISESRDRTGWVAGLGGEFAVWTAGWADVTLKVEYLHAGFETKQYFLANAFTPIRDTKLTDDIVRAGVNVKFNWGPVVARY